MNKNLLLGSALLVAISAFPQAVKQAKPNGFVNETFSNRPISDQDLSSQEKKTTLVKSLTRPTVAAKTASTIATSCTRFSNSYNGAGVYLGGQECLSYNPDVNAVAFIHRSAPSYSTIPNGNSGTQIAKYSTNAGITWDSTVYYTSTVNLGRYPQGGIYNPAGNTNINNAYIVGMGPTTPGAGWNGSWAASKKITTPGTTTPGSDMQFFTNVGPFTGPIKKNDFPRYGFSFTKDGLVRGLGEIVNDVAGTTNLTFGPRGVSILKGSFVAGAFVWSYDSLIPPTILRGDGTKQWTPNQAEMAWNDAGNVGYVMMIGSRAGTTGTMKGYQPIIYKTTNAGASWVLFAANDFMTPKFQGLVDRMWATASNTNLAIPFFSNSEGMDMAVDVNDQLHIATTVVGSYSGHNDSLEYTSIWGTEKYSFPYGGNFGFPTIYDFYTTTAGSWNYHIVDSMGTEGPAGTSTGGGFASNPWSASAYPLDARIQVSHSPDRKKIFYSWTESDTTATGFLHWNSFPDIKTRGLDVTIDKVTQRLNVTGTVTSPQNADQTAYMHYMSNRTILTNSVLNTNEIPFTISYNSGLDGNQPVNHYYIKGASFTQTDFTLNPMRPVGIQSLANNTPSYEVINYPNPASGSTTISVKLKEVKNFEINVYNTIGSLMQTVKVNGQTGNNDVTLDISKLSAGVYFYSVKADDSVITNKLIVE